MGLLARTLLAIGSIMLLAALALSLSGHAGVAPQLTLFGFILTAGVAFERWIYKGNSNGRPQPGWQATGERFIDPGSGQLTEVWFDPRSGQRHYLRVDKS